MPELDPLFVPIKGDREGLEEVKRQMREVAAARDQAARQIGGGAGPTSTADLLRRQGATESEIRRFYRGSSQQYTPPPPTTVGPMGGGGGTSRPHPGFLHVRGEGPRPHPGFLNVRGEAPGVSEPNVGLMMSSKAAAERMDKLKKAAEGAAESTSKFGLRTAWILRSATGGGPLGALGGGLGALAGLAFGNPAFGSLMGNMAGRQAGDSIGSLRGVVGTANPGAAYQFDRAAADFQGVIGRSLTPTLDYFTQKTRMAADALSANERGVRNFGKGMEAAAEFGLEFLGLNQAIKREAALRPGGSVGASVSPLGGHVFRSANELDLAYAQHAIMNARGIVPGAGSAMGGAGGIGPPAPQATPEHLSEARRAAQKVASFLPSTETGALGGGVLAAALKKPIDPDILPQWHSLRKLPGESTTDWMRRDEAAAKAFEEDWDRKFFARKSAEAARALAAPPGFEPWQWFLFTTTIK